MKSLFSRFILSNPAKVSLVFLTIEFLDELVDSLRATSWPAIRSDLGLSYEAIGILISAPRIFGSIVEFFIGVAADHGHKSKVMIFGGLFFALSLVAIALSQSFWPLLLAMMLFNPASGAFVSLAQVSLMDLYPKRKEQMMARWTLSGTLSHLVGPILFLYFVGSPLGWQGGFIVASALSFMTLLCLIKVRITIPFHHEEKKEINFITGVSSIFSELKRKTVLKWLAVLELSDFMLDILSAFLALYLVDVMRLSVEEAASLIFVRAISAVVGELSVVFIFEYISGIKYLLFTSAVAVVSYTFFLTNSNLLVLCTLLSIVTFCTAGWYSVLKAGLYNSLPNRGGAVIAIHSVTGLLNGLIPFILGVLADHTNMKVTMWVLMLGALAVFALSLWEQKLSTFKSFEQKEI